MIAGRLAGYRLVENKLPEGVVKMLVHQIEDLLVDLRADRNLTTQDRDLCQRLVFEIFLNHKRQFVDLHQQYRCLQAMYFCLFQHYGSIYYF